MIDPLDQQFYHPARFKASLTPREREIARYVATGATSKAIATALCLSLRTVNNHLQAIYLKLDVNSRTQLAVIVERGLLP